MTPPVATGNLSSHPPSPIAIVTIDGPTASGKGTVARLVAQSLGFHYLDSGAIYRVLAYVAKIKTVAWQDVAGLTILAAQLAPRFMGEQVWLDDTDISSPIRSEAISQGASAVAAHPPVRQALLSIQRGFAKSPGLVADGRDMGSVVFADAKWKFFLDASAEVRAQRRYRQLLAMGVEANFDAILRDLQTRDARDRERSVAPLQRLATAQHYIFTDSINADQATSQILACISSVKTFA